MITSLKKIQKNTFIIPTYAEICKRDFFSFVQMFWDTIISEEPVYNWHIPYLCKELEIVAHRVFKRLPKLYDLAINIPPGTTKTTVCTILFTAWCWTNNPDMRFLHGSHGMPLAIRNTSKIRKVIKSDKFKLLYPNIELDRSQDGKSNFANTANGEITSCSTLASPIGNHCHFAIVDDGQNPKGALSDANYLTVKEFVDEGLSQRKVDKKVTVTIYIQQRLRGRDLTSHLLKQREDGLAIRYICLPAEIVQGSKIYPKELEKKYINGLLDPIRLSKEILAENRIKLGSYGYSAQYLQDPKPEGGGIIKAFHFGRFNLTTIEHMASQYNDKLVWNFTVDTAYTKDSKNNDPTGILAFANYKNNVYIRNVMCKWLEFNPMIKFIEDFANNNGYTDQSRIWIEPKASGISAAQAIKENTKLNIILDESPKDSKLQRVYTNLPFLESGRVFLLEGAGFVEPYINEVTVFPAGERNEHDERVDITMMAINKSKKQKSFYIG